MERRVLLKNSALLAGAACLPEILTASEKPVCSPFCQGPTCAALGMVGTYPQCYYPQYLNVNVTLMNNGAHAAAIALYHAAAGALTATDNQNFRQYVSAGFAHLSIWQSYIAESTRKQVTNQLPNRQVLTAGENQFLGQVGIDYGLGADFQNWANQYMPPTRYTVPSVIDMIESLPLYPAQDNIQAFVSTQLSSVQVEGGSPCGLSTSDIAKLNESARLTMQIAGIIGNLGSVIPPLGPYIFPIGRFYALIGGGLTMYAAHCAP